jgi:xylulose-5-phosphate/fructose-6-phosphate phosphoketolase
MNASHHDQLLFEAELTIEQDDLDRFHLVQDVVDRVPNLGTKGANLKQLIQTKLIEHKRYIDEHGQYMPDIRNLKWSITNHE